jgi:hypothetical protein
MSDNEYKNNDMCNNDNIIGDREAMVDAINERLRCVSDKTIQEIYRYASQDKCKYINDVIVKNEYINKKVVKAKKNPTDRKIEIALDAINSILSKLDMNIITELTQLNIKRDDLIRDEVTECLEEEYGNVFLNDIFDKKECGWYNRNRVQTYSVTFMKCLIKQIPGYKFTSKTTRGKDSHTSYIIVRI